MQINKAQFDHAMDCYIAARRRYVYATTVADRKSAAEDVALAEEDLRQIRAEASPCVPTIHEVDASPESGADPRTLCANWRRGCNGVTNGPQNGRLTLCDECEQAKEN